ncbi:MAG: gliding motility-associated C-terminal domain-containing protein, partial [Sphingobacteriales bacterium]|nr:gliding motility-associated C-terminal domain-containing protein [Sphingobacteriales bacterium]
APDPLVVIDEADNCSAPVVAFVSDVTDGNLCPETITRTYSVTDNCGNQITVTQLIQITDPIMPTASNPVGVTVQCIGDVPAADPLVVTDEADNNGVPVVAFVSDVSDGNTCPETITRTYSVTDDCGNQITVTQTIVVDDTTNPTASNPAGVTVQCIGDVPASDPLVVTDETDNCSVPVVAFVSDVSDGNTCPETITRTYSVTDACGNQITVTQTIVVDDTTNPTASNPASVTVDIIANVPAPDPLVVTDEADNCTAAPAVAFVSDVSDGNTCPETITRTYSVTDNCGNQITVTQTIIVSDMILPTASNPAAVNVQCIANVPASDPLVVIDEADNNGVPVVAFVSDVSDGNTCPETITRTYSVTDPCGNQITVTQQIIVNDTTNPTATNPAGVTVQCIGDVPASDITVVTDEADNCTAAPVVAFVSDVSDGNTCPETITRTYSVTDDCGNQITVTQTI